MSLRAPRRTKICRRGRPPVATPPGAGTGALPLRVTIAIFGVGPCARLGAHKGLGYTFRTKNLLLPRHVRAKCPKGAKLHPQNMPDSVIVFGNWSMCAGICPGVGELELSKRHQWELDLVRRAVKHSV